MDSDNGGDTWRATLFLDGTTDGAKMSAGVHDTEEEAAMAVARCKMLPRLHSAPHVPLPC